MAVEIRRRFITGAHAVGGSGGGSAAGVIFFNGLAVGQIVIERIAEEIFRVGSVGMFVGQFESTPIRSLLGGAENQIQADFRFAFPMFEKRRRRGGRGLRPDFCDDIRAAEFVGAAENDFALRNFRERHGQILHPVVGEHEPVRVFGNDKAGDFISIFEIQNNVLSASTTRKRASQKHRHPYSKE